MGKIFSAAAATLQQHPKFGKPGILPGTREYLVHRSYRMVYRIAGDTVWILALIHTSRLWPPAQG
jgi:plasmid stabilization system protein ParE